MKKTVAVFAAVVTLSGLTWLFHPRPDISPPPSAAAPARKSRMECFKGRELLLLKGKTR